MTILTQLLSTLRRLHLRPVPVFLLCTCLVISIALAINQWVEAREKADMHGTLIGIGQLKVRQIRSYLAERGADAVVISDLLRTSANWLTEPSGNPSLAFQHTTAFIARAHQYRSILVLVNQADTLHVRLVIGQHGGLTAAGQTLALQALHERTPVVSLYAGDANTSGEAVLDLFFPVLTPDKTGVLGLVIMRSNSAYLFDLLQSWPVVSATAETLLVAQEGNDVVFLNELRHRQHTALKLRMPLSDQASSAAWPAISAVMGHYGSLEALDYRGQPVLAYTLPVPETPWSLVVKMDTDEALQHSHRLRGLAICLSLLLIALFAVLIWQSWARTQADRLINDKLRAAEANLHRAQAVAGVGSWLMDVRCNVLSWSTESYRIFGVTPGTPVTYETFLDCVHPDDRTFVDQQWQAALHGQPYDITHRLLVKGQLKWVRERAELHFDSHGQLIGGLGTTQDITEYRRLENALRQSQEQFMKVFEEAPIGMLICDLECQTLQSNRALQKIFGYSEAELLSIPFQQVIHPDDRDRVIESHQTLLQGNGEAYSQEDIRYLRKDNEVVWGRATAALVRDMQGKPSCTVTMLEDVTERKQTEEEMKLAALVYQSSNEGIQVMDADNHILAVNPAFTAITGYTAQEVIGKNPSLLRSSHHDQAFYTTIWQELNTTGKWQGEIWNRRKNGECYVEWLSINTIYRDNGSVRRRVALFSDITAKKKNEELIWQQANYDGLTGLPNRHMLHDRLARAIKKTHRTALPLALLFIDLDRFKEVNDSLGHEMGDILLKEAALRMENCVRETDTVARFGGDEFVIILSEINSIDCVARIAHNLLSKLAEPFQLGVETVYISASIGAALYPTDATDVATLLRFADQAMYAAKSEGRNRFQYYRPVMQETINARMRLANDMHKALANQQLRVYYQPIVELSTGAIYKAEALIRWQHPLLGLVSPADFIPIAEVTGMITGIGDWVFYQAVAQAARLRATYHPEFQISINKSPVQFLTNFDNHTCWLDHLQRLGLPAQALVIEITESLLMEVKDRISDQLQAFKDNGVAVALDDFGTGYSSLSYLRKFDIDYIKIDQSFVHNLAADTRDMALCETIINMAHKLGMKVVAEGVATLDQYRLLAQMGCDFGQGYFFAKPLPPDALERLLSEQRLSRDTSVVQETAAFERIDHIL